MGAHFDPLGETEPEDTVYTLKVLCPPRPPPTWLPSFMTRTPVTHASSGSTYTIKPDETNANLDCFERKHLADMPRKTIKLKRVFFPLELRCDHVRHAKECLRGCYVQEKSGSIWRKKCAREDCEGHVYVGQVREDEQGISCFGKKGQRLVCLEEPYC
ncbi:hypothetical protein IQ06DRAFT_214107 [Phaeosphaeriaceae sp. SRC1lsM3a]|nr:hypothetical protein IQ06DRAFT_214107 [Stagonospora sp. SRC1lsM3a]